MRCISKLFLPVEKWLQHALPGRGHLLVVVGTLQTNRGQVRHDNS
jgi:hypothetical protein